MSTRYFIIFLIILYFNQFNYVFCVLIDYFSKSWYYI
nr:MAG TPA: hypothetical protein [Caudoviricetes sp.]